MRLCDEDPESDILCKIFNLIDSSANATEENNFAALISHSYCVYMSIHNIHTILEYKFRLEMVDTRAWHSHVVLCDWSLCMVVFAFLNVNAM